MPVYNLCLLHAFVIRQKCLSNKFWKDDSSDHRLFMCPQGPFLLIMTLQNHLHHCLQSSCGCQLVKTQTMAEPWDTNWSNQLDYSFSVPFPSLPHPCMLHASLFVLYKLPTHDLKFHILSSPKLLSPAQPSPLNPMSHLHVQLPTPDTVTQAHP